MRYTGEVADANEAQVFAWQARCKGIDVHSLAEPTRLESLKREFEKQKEQQKSSLQNELLEKYGGEVGEGGGGELLELDVLNYEKS